MLSVGKGRGPAGSCPVAQPDGRRVALTAVAAWTVGWTWWLRMPSGISWHFFVDGAQALVQTSGLHLYAQHPTLQIGPVTFVVTAMITWLPPATARMVAQCS